MIFLIVLAGFDENKVLFWFLFFYSLQVLKIHIYPYIVEVNSFDFCSRKYEELDSFFMFKILKVFSGSLPFVLPFCAKIYQYPLRMSFCFLPICFPSKSGGAGTKWGCSMGADQLSRVMPKRPKVICGCDTKGSLVLWMADLLCIYGGIRTAVQCFGFCFSDLTRFHNLYKKTYN